MKKSRVYEKEDEFWSKVWEGSNKIVIRHEVVI